MVFWINIKQGYKNYRLKVVQEVINDRSEHFTIIGNNKEITVESNRPFFRNRGLKHRKPDFKLIAGKLEHGGSIDRLTEAIMKHLEP